jgi:hypothetical protein
MPDCSILIVGFLLKGEGTMTFSQINKCAHAYQNVTGTSWADALRQAWLFSKTLKGIEAQAMQYVEHLAETLGWLPEKKARLAHVLVTYSHAPRAAQKLVLTIAQDTCKGKRTPAASYLSGGPMPTLPQRYVSI